MNIKTLCTLYNYNKYFNIFPLLFEYLCYYKCGNEEVLLFYLKSIIQNIYFQIYIFLGFKQLDLKIFSNEFKFVLSSSK